MGAMVKERTATWSNENRPFLKGVGIKENGQGSIIQSVISTRNYLSMF